ncbi:MAG: glycosyltransferase [Cytophagales bacterium]
METNKTIKNHKLRSNYIRTIVQSKKPLKPKIFLPSIPKIIIQFWHDKNNIPLDVLKCLDSWNVLKHKSFKIILYDDNSARDYIQKNYPHDFLKAYNNCRHPAMRSDYFRLCYIYKSGGIYVDADEIYNGNDLETLLLDKSLKLQPLCYSAKSKSMIPFDSFVTNANYSDDWIFYINNNPIIAPPKHSLIYTALKQATYNIANSVFSSNDIQSISGPGNLTSSFVELSIKNGDQDNDFVCFFNWELFSKCQWDLNYRKDERNWRRWKKMPNSKVFNNISD